MGASAFAPAQTGKSSTALNAVEWNEGTKALPFGSSPSTLDGSLPGDVGFDPIGFSTQPIASFNNPLYVEGNFMSDVEWLREAELATAASPSSPLLASSGPASSG